MSTVWAQVVWCVLVASSAVIYGVWLIDRKHTYLMFIAAAPVTIAVSMLANLLPIDAQYRLAVHGLVFIGGAFLAQEGFARRAGAATGASIIVAVCAVLGAAAVLLLGMTHGSLLWQVHVQDLTIAIMGFTGLWRGRLLSSGRLGDRAAGVLVLIAGVYFVVRSWIAFDTSALTGEEHLGLDVFTPPFVICFAFLAVSIAGSLTVQEVSTVIETLRAERDTDVLTDVLNRRGLQSAVARAGSGPASSSFVVFDLDNFKPVNDRYGHAVGDDVLRDFSTVLRAAAGTSDVIGRLGGDEFAVLLTGTTAGGVQAFAERVCTEFAGTQTVSLPAGVTVTASFGTTTVVPGAAFTDLVAAADKHLYRAKRGERNPE